MSVVSEHCYACPIYQRAGRCEAVYPKQAADGRRVRYVVIGEAPGRQELEQGTPFIGPAGALLRQVLSEAGIDVDECVFANATWCAPRDPAGRIDRPKQDEVQACLLHTWSYVWAYRPEAIILVGGVALEGVTGKGGITKVHGRPMRLIDFSHRLPHAIRYADYRAWAAQKVSGGDELLPGLDVALPAGEQALAEWQMAAARARYGWRPCAGTDCAVVPTLHPSYVLRSGGEQSAAMEEFRADFAQVVEATRPQPEVSYRLLDTLEAVEEYVDETLDLYRRGEVEYIAVDCEGSEELGEDLIWMGPFHPRTRLLTVQITRAAHAGVMIYVSHRASNFCNPYNLRYVVHHLKRLFRTVPSVGQNYGHDLHWLRCKLGITDVKAEGDTEINNHWLQMGRNLPANLPALAFRYCKLPNHKAELERFRAENRGKTFEDAPLDMELRYAVGDSDVTWQVFAETRRRLREEGRWESLYDIFFGRHGAYAALIEMEWQGMYFDPARWRKANEEFPRQIVPAMEAMQKNPFVMTWSWLKMQQHNAAAQEYNAQLGAPGDRRKPKKVYRTFEDWHNAVKVDRKTGESTPLHRWNPGSWQQVDEMWHSVIKPPFHIIDDLEYKDREQRQPRANGHNRKILVAAFETFAAASEAELAKYVVTNPDGTTAWDEAHHAAVADLQQRAEYWQAAADLHRHFNTWKALDKVYGTYVAGAPSITADWPDDPEQPVAERWLPIYRSIGDLPRAYCLHAAYDPSATRTARLASKHPNGQNLPARDVAVASLVKQMYVSRWLPRGGLLLFEDLSQIEVRVMVMLALAWDIAKAIDAGLDIHRFMASKVFRTTYEAVTAAQRKPTKNITFGILYGQGITALARALKISRDEAQSIMDAFFRQIPEVRALIDKYHEVVKEHGYVETLFKRRRWIDEVRSGSEALIARGLREAVNTPIQSAASDMTLTAIGRVWKTVRYLQIPHCVPWTTIHDSQGWDVLHHVIDLMHVLYYQNVYAPYELWDWVICRPEAEFEIGADWGNTVDMRMVWEDREAERVDPEHLVLSGTVDRLDSVCDTWTRTAQIDVVGEQPHPNAEEARRGVRERTIHVQRDRVLCRLDGRKLYDAAGNVISV